MENTKPKRPPWKKDMQIERTAANEIRKTASSARKASLMDSQSITSITNGIRPGTVDILAYDCPDPDGGESRYEYTLTLSASEVVELLFKLNPSSIAESVERTARDYQQSPHTDVNRLGMELIQHFAAGFRSAMKTR